MSTGPYPPPPVPRPHNGDPRSESVAQPRPGRDNSDVRAAASITVALAVIGALLGLVWGAWSPPGSAARITPAGRLQDETEAWIAADGRYLVLSVAIGLVAALAAWRRVKSRGPAVLLGLAAGGLAGSALMWFVGWLTGGGSDTGKTINGVSGFIAHQRVTLHTDGLFFVQAGVAVLVYGLLVAFTSRDDLGRADPLRELLQAEQRARQPLPVAPGQPYNPPPQPYGQPYGQPSVGPGAQPQYGGGDGDAAGPLQQRDLPPQ